MLADNEWVEMLSDRGYLYLTKEWTTAGCREVVAEQVSAAMLHQDSTEWIVRLEAKGFRTVGEAGESVLLRRSGGRVAAGEDHVAPMWPTGCEAVAGLGPTPHPGVR